MEKYISEKKQNRLTNKVFAILGKADRKAERKSDLRLTPEFKYINGKHDSYIDKNFEKISALISSGASVNDDKFVNVPSIFNHYKDNHDSSDDNYTMLTWAVKRKQEKLMNFLLENGADINKIPYSNRFLPIEFAIINNDAKMVKLLIDKGSALIRPGKYSYDKSTSILETVLKENSADCGKILLNDEKTKRKFDLNMVMSNGETPLTYLLNGGNTNVVGGPDYFWAEQEKREILVKQLLENGADLNAKNGKGESPLMLVSRIQIDSLKDIMLCECLKQGLFNEKEQEQPVIVEPKLEKKKDKELSE